MSGIERNAQRTLAVYIHWPYCQSKCPYCDFNSHPVRGAEVEDQSRWAQAYAREIKHYAELLPGRRVTSVFFGGGTPSLMEPQTVAAVLGAIQRGWALAGDAEITLEANPGSVEARKFAGFRAAGVNRLSLGVQSLRDEALAFLGRKHNAAEARRAIAIAAENFPRFSFDLIYARQGQTLTAWEEELREALQLAGEHLSLYQLTIEPGTQFHTRAGRGEELTASEEPAVAMYERTQEILRDAGLPAYEVSNHAKPGAESRHNLAYWRYEDYIGVGPGAHGRYRPDNRTIAAENHRAPEVWLDEVGKHGHGHRTGDALAAADTWREALMMGMRLAEGINRAAWEEKFGSKLDALVPPARAEKLVSEGYLSGGEKTLQATAAGLQRLNAVLDYLLN